MNTTLKAVVVQLSGGNVRNSHINPRGIFGLFPDDCRGGESAAGKPVSVRSGAEEVAADIDKTKAIFRERGAIPAFLQDGERRGGRSRPG